MITGRDEEAMAGEDLHIEMNCVISQCRRSREDSVVCSSMPRQINIAVQNPFPVPNKTVAISMGLQFNFVMPTNISEFRQTKKPKREAPGQVLLSIYQPLEALLEDYGFEGRACVLRSICEAAGSPFKHEGSDLLDEIAHIILTPSEEDSMTHFDCNGNSSSLQHLQEERDYLVAECLGKTGKDCSAVYADCFEPPLDLMSNVYHVDYSF
ncbi:uncharacterized protein [Periplaneta americana]|uniref:uncharacterized protein n=1 Tax=Periplaneta americana TaxID=6978 RepID=UPI0037E94D58